MNISAPRETKDSFEQEIYIAKAGPAAPPQLVSRRGLAFWTGAEEYIGVYKLVKVAQVNNNIELKETR